MIARGIQLVPLAKLMGHEDARITLSRYAHLYDRERSVRVYDYTDTRVPVLRAMHKRRLATYKTLGFEGRGADAGQPNNRGLS